MKKWQCSVCGYIHTGDEPPETCPVCGADRNKFVELDESTDGSASPVSRQKENHSSVSPAIEPQTRAPLDIINNLLVKHHLHPISVHFPNGMVPAIVLFMLLAIFFHSESLAAAAFYNALFVLLALPVVLYTGFNEWRKKYKSSLARMFIIKITAASIVTASAMIIVLIHLINPEITQTPSVMRLGYLLLHLIMLAATGIAGFIGGKLVFKD